MFAYLISISFETHGTLQVCFQMKIDQGLKSKEIWKTLNISYENTSILLMELESSISSITESTRNLKNCWISITIVFRQIEHFLIQTKLHVRYYPKEELGAVFKHTESCGVNTHFSFRKKEKNNVKICNSTVKSSPLLKLLLIVVLLVVYCCMLSVFILISTLPVSPQGWCLLMELGRQCLVTQINLLYWTQFCKVVSQLRFWYLHAYK